MNYTKQTWTNGDVITAEKLNHMEDGIGGSSIEPLTITITYYENTGTFTANKTYEEFNQEWIDAYDHLMESTDLDKTSVPCTITYVEHYDDEEQPTTTVYNGRAIDAVYSDSNGGRGIALVAYFNGVVSYDSGDNSYKYIEFAYGVMFYQHQADDVIISMW